MSLYEEVTKLKPKIKNTVDLRIREFEELRKENENILFQELCFCILTANSSAKTGMKIQEKIGTGFINYPEEKLRVELKNTGYRFWNVRAKYIVEARWIIPEMKNIFRMPEVKAREYLANNVRGLGMKESSHFLRNTGAKNLAIIDRHILRVLDEHSLINIPKYLSRKKYLEIEDIERNVAEHLKMNLAELDLYLWYIKTGEVLK